MPELMLKRDLGKKPYRLKCRFKIEPYPKKSRLDREKVTIAERFVRDMRAQGWEHDARYGFEMRGPFPMVIPTTIHRARPLSAREMLPRLIAGERFRDGGTDGVTLVPSLAATEWWEYEIKGVFVRETVLVEIPDGHEERN